MRDILDVVRPKAEARYAVFYSFADGADGAIAQGDRHGNREAKKPKKLKPKEMVPVSTLAWIQKAHEAANPTMATPISGRCS